MIDGILEALRAPMAAPPGRRSVVGRYAPEICAALVYAVAVIVAVYFADEQHPVLIGALTGYGVACLLMIVGPVSTAAQCLVGEYEGRTAEALVLTSGDHARLAVGRYWHAALPWLRFMLWLLPIYASHAVNGGIDADSGEELLGYSGIVAVGPRAYLIGFMAVGIDRGGMNPCWALGLTAVRFCVDAIGVLLASAIAFGMSARARKGWAAAVVSYALVVASFLTVFMAAEWAAVLIGALVALAQLMGVHASSLQVSPWLLLGLYFGGRVLMVGFEAWTARWLVRRVARNFDAYLLGERPDGGGERAPAAGVPG